MREQILYWRRNPDMLVEWLFGYKLPWYKRMWLRLFSRIKDNKKSTIFTWSLRLDLNQYLLSYEDNALPLSYLEALVLLLGLEPRTSSLSEKCSKPTELQQDINGTELRTRTLINSFGDCHVTKLHQLCIGSACEVRTREYRLEGPVCSPLH